MPRRNSPLHGSIQYDSEISPTLARTVSPAIRNLIAFTCSCLISSSDFSVRRRSLPCYTLTNPPKDLPFSFLYSTLIQHCVISLSRRNGFNLSNLPSEDHSESLFVFLIVELHAAGLLQACVLQKVYYGLDGYDPFMSAL